MFDVPFGFERLLDRERTADLLKVDPKTLQRCAPTRLVVALCFDRLRQFRGSDLDGKVPENISLEQLSVLPHHS
jgi:hypothetical protein